MTWWWWWWWWWTLSLVLSPGQLRHCQRTNGRVVLTKRRQDGSLAAHSHPHQKRHLELNEHGGWKKHEDSVQRAWGLRCPHYRKKCEFGWEPTQVELPQQECCWHEMESPCSLLGTLVVLRLESAALLQTQSHPQRKRSLERTWNLPPRAGYPGAVPEVLGWMVDGMWDRDPLPSWKILLSLLEMRTHHHWGQVHLQ